MTEHFPIYKGRHQKGSAEIIKVIQREKQSLIQQLLFIPFECRPGQQIRTALIDHFMIKNNSKLAQDYQFDRKPLTEVVAPVSKEQQFPKASVIGNFIRTNDFYQNISKQKKPDRQNLRNLTVFNQMSEKQKTPNQKQYFPIKEIQKPRKQTFFNPIKQINSECQKQSYPIKGIQKPRNQTAFYQIQKIQKSRNQKQFYPTKEKQKPVLVKQKPQNQRQFYSIKQRQKPVLAKSQLLNAQQYAYDHRSKSPSILDVSNNLSQLHKFESDQKQIIGNSQGNSAQRRDNQIRIQNNGQQKWIMNSNQKNSVNPVQAFEKFNSIFRKRQTAENSRVSNLTSKLFGNHQPNQQKYRINEFQAFQAEAQDQQLSKQGHAYNRQSGRIKSEFLNIPSQSSQNMFDFNSQLLQQQKSEVSINSQARSIGKPSKLHALIMKTVNLNLNDKNTLSKVNKADQKYAFQNILSANSQLGQQDSNCKIFESLNRVQNQPQQPNKANKRQQQNQINKVQQQNKINKVQQLNAAKVVLIDLQKESSRSKSLLKADQNDFEFDEESQSSSKQINVQEIQRQRIPTNPVQSKEQQNYKNKNNKKIKIMRINSRKESSSSQGSNSYISLSKFPSFQESYSAKSFSKIQINPPFQNASSKQIKPENTQDKAQKIKQPISGSIKNQKQRILGIQDKESKRMHQNSVEQQLSDEIFQNYESSSSNINHKPSQHLAAVIEETDEEESIFIPNLQETPSIKEKKSRSQQLPKEQMAVPQDLSSIKFDSDNKISEQDFSRNNGNRQDQVDNIKKYVLEDIKKDVSNLSGKMLQDLGIESASDVSSSSLVRNKKINKDKSGDFFEEIDRYNDYSQIVGDFDKLKGKIVKDNQLIFD